MSETPSWPTNDPEEPSGERAAPPPDAEAPNVPTPTSTAPIPPPPPPLAPSPVAPSASATPSAAADGAGASLGVRFAARLLDGLLLGAVTWLLPDFGLLVAGILAAIIAMGYYVGMETTQGGTLGKLMLGLKVQGPSGALPSVEESAKRNIWLAFQIVPFIGGLAGIAAAIGIAVTIQTSENNRGFHDDFAGTTVTKR